MTHWWIWERSTLKLLCGITFGLSFVLQVQCKPEWRLTRTLSGGPNFALLSCLLRKRRVSRGKNFVAKGHANTMSKLERLGRDTWLKSGKLISMKRSLFSINTYQNQWNLINHPYILASWCSLISTPENWKEVWCVQGTFWRPSKAKRKISLSSNRRLSPNWSSSKCYHERIWLPIFSRTWFFPPNPWPSLCFSICRRITTMADETTYDQIQKIPLASEVGIHARQVIFLLLLRFVVISYCYLLLLLCFSFAAR